MSEIRRYILTSIGLALKQENSKITTDDLCKYEDVAHIIQRVAELETENSVQRLQIDHLEAELARLREQMPSIWEVLYMGKGIAYFDHVPHIGDLPANSLVRKLYAEPNPAQIPAALIEWANLSEYEPTQWHKGYEAARRWVKMQLDTMKEKS